MIAQAGGCSNDIIKLLCYEEELWLALSFFLHDKVELRFKQGVPFISITIFDSHIVLTTRLLGYGLSREWTIQHVASVALIHTRVQATLALYI